MIITDFVWKALSGTIAQRYSQGDYNCNEIQNWLGGGT